MKIGFLSSFIFLLALPEGLKGEAADMITATKVIIDPEDFEEDTMFITIYPEVKTLIECSSLAFLDFNETKLFCKTPEGHCLLSNTSYPANYDDDSGGGGYRCYTTEKPLIDIAAALAACGNATLCCPPPYEMVTDVGCIYGNFWSAQTYKAALNSCKTHWPTSTLLPTPPIYTSLIPYINAKWLMHPWVGVEKQADGLFYWLDGTPTVSSDWKSGEPNDKGNSGIRIALWTIGTSRPVDCAASWTVRGLVGMYPPKLNDRYCFEYHHYLCQITA